MLVFNNHPLSAIMIVLIALLNDIPIMMIQNSVVYILDDYARNAADLLIEQLNTGGVHYEY